ncbi:hypothetical protein GCM10008066_04110 [Oxalicibacterium faecigallinarum]|uniref:Uncharacterized protein n=2 Tax=Oxalicibacterium faecigallinarum TaxID=573741 RepID=A0A8J3AL70_9BURK|nr:hypothetical protein GCM10008066_04110 [Oxalicibacterium faecigallinarum]
MTLIVSMVAALVILVHGVFFAINRMSRCTPLPFRLGWLAVTIGALAYLVSPFYGYRPPSILEAFLLSGLAMFVLFDKRCRQRRKGDVPR